MRLPDTERRAALIDRQQRAFDQMFMISTRYTAQALKYGVFPATIPDAMLPHLMLNSFDMYQLGYEKVGNGWVRKDFYELGEDTLAAAEGGAGAGGYYGGGGWGYGGGGWGGGGTTRMPHSRVQTGGFGRALTGRIFNPDTSGQISWRI
jgi:hypothetical protein